MMAGSGRVIAVALFTVLLMAPTVRAAVQTTPEAPADSYPQLGAVLSVARAAWPGSPCAGRETITFVQNIGSATEPLGSVLGAAPLWGRDRCLVGLSPTLLAPGDLYELCVVVTHEFGHLDGQAHSTDPASIMYAYANTVDYPPCHAIVPAPGSPPASPSPPPIRPAPPPAAQPGFLLSIRDAQVNTRRALHRHKQWRDGGRRHVRCGYTNRRIVCRADWRYRHRSYRATVTFGAKGRTVHVYRKAST